MKQPVTAPSVLNTCVWCGASSPKDAPAAYHFAGCKGMADSAIRARVESLNGPELLKLAQETASVVTIGARREVLLRRLGCSEVH